ncbi:MAG: hypothetical protein U0350_37165 [Caldilineaceae bacterium]
MRIMQKGRKPLYASMLALLLVANWLGAPFAPLPAHAAPNTPNQVSADPAKEIVYIDGNGIIRIVDWQTSGGPLADWSSDLDKNADGSVHGNDFRDFALADVNNDGDMEIVGMRGDSTNGELIVYDPVISPGQVTKSNQKTPNGIPWDKLYDAPLKGKPVLVAGGDFDVNIPGDEITYVYELNAAEKTDPSDNQRLVVLDATSPTPDGRSWQEHASRVFSNNWQTLDAGNFDGSGAEELVMVDENTTGGELNVFRVDSGIARIGKAKGSNSAPWNYAAFGNWDGGNGKQEIFAVRDGNGLPSFYVWQWNGDNVDFKELYNEKFNPGPRFVFPADINGDTKQEAFMIRTIPSGTKAARLIPRGLQQSKIPSELETALDSDNGYRAGAGGDIDGDGKDELVLLRDNKLLIFTNPENSGSTTTRDVTTNRHSIKIGDLDKNGFASGPQFCANLSTLSDRLPIGVTGPAKSDLTLTNCGSTDVVPFSLDSYPNWLTVSPVFGQTPATLTYNFDTRNLNPGVYTATLTINSTANVVNKPFIVKLSLTVTAADVSAQSASALFNYTNCVTPTNVLTQTIALNGSSGVKYTAAVVAVPTVAAAQAALSGPISSGYINGRGELLVRDAAGHEALVAPVTDSEVMASSIDSAWPSGVSWLKATSRTDIIPDTLTLRADTSISPTQEFKQAYVILVADARAGTPPNNIRVIPVYMMCTRSQIRLPLVTR